MVVKLKKMWLKLEKEKKRKSTRKGVILFEMDGLHRGKGAKGLSARPSSFFQGEGSKRESLSLERRGKGEGK